MEGLFLVSTSNFETDYTRFVLIYSAFFSSKAPQQTLLIYSNSTFQLIKEVVYMPNERRHSSESGKKYWKSISINPEKKAHEVLRFSHFGDWRKNNRVPISMASLRYRKDYKFGRRCMRTLKSKHL